MKYKLISFENLTLKEISERLDRCGVCWGPYRTFRQMLEEDPRCSTENPMFSKIDQPGVGRHLVPGSPLSFGGPLADDRNALKAPLLGEHTEQVLADDLKLSSVEIGNLADHGLIFTVS